MEETHALCKKLRPNAKWGFYLFPACFKRSPGQNYCKKSTIDQNDKMSWLYRNSKALYPSLYLKSQQHPELQRLFVEAALRETYRVSRRHCQRDALVIPYARYSYPNNKQFYSKSDLESSIGQAADSGAAGIVLWDSYKNIQDKTDCKKTHKYLHTTLGPFVNDVLKFTQKCCDNLCSGHGRCISRQWSNYGLVSSGKQRNGSGHRRGKRSTNKSATESKDSGSNAHSNTFENFQLENFETDGTFVSERIFDHSYDKIKLQPSDTESHSSTAKFVSLQIKPSKCTSTGSVISLEPAENESPNRECRTDISVFGTQSGTSLEIGAIIKPTPSNDQVMDDTMELTLDLETSYPNMPDYILKSTFNHGIYHKKAATLPLSADDIYSLPSSNTASPLSNSLGYPEVDFVTDELRSTYTTNDFSSTTLTIESHSANDVSTMSVHPFNTVDHQDAEITAENILTSLALAFTSATSILTPSWEYSTVLDPITNTIAEGQSVHLSNSAFITKTNLLLTSSSIGLSVDQGFTAQLTTRTITLPDDIHLPTETSSEVFGNTIEAKTLQPTVVLRKRAFRRRSRYFKRRRRRKKLRKRRPMENETVQKTNIKRKKVNIRQQFSNYVCRCYDGWTGEFCQHKMYPSK